MFVFFEDMATGRLAMPQWRTLHQGEFEEHRLELAGSLRSNKNSALGVVGLGMDLEGRRRKNTTR